MILHPQSRGAQSAVPTVRCSTFHFEKGQRVATAGPYDQKSFELIRAKIFSTGVTKIAVRKVAIRKSKLDLVGRTVIFSNDQVRTDYIHNGNVNQSCYSGD